MKLNKQYVWSLKIITNLGDMASLQYIIHLIRILHVTETKRHLVTIEVNFLLKKIDADWDWQSKGLLFMVYINPY